MSADLAVHTCFLFACGLVAAGIVLSSSELVSLHGQFRSGGLYDWNILRLRRRVDSHGPIAAATGVLFQREAFLGVLGVRIVAAGCMIVGAALGRVDVLPVGVALATQLLLTYRQAIGGDGSDQMTSVVLVTLFLYAIQPANPISATACVWFLAGQSILSYTASGGAKLFSRKWRSGSALYEILNTRTYGTRSAAVFLAEHPLLSRGATYSVMTMQVTFVLVLFLPWPYNIVYIVWGLGFHLAIAALMGLNIFPFPFSACYAPVIYCAFQMHRWIG